MSPTQEARELLILFHNMRTEMNEFFSCHSFYRSLHISFKLRLTSQLQIESVCKKL